MADAGVGSGVDAGVPLLNGIGNGGGDENSSNFIEGVVDYKGERVINENRSKFGRWKSASLIIVTEIAQAFTFLGIVSNLITYLTGPLRQSTANAAANVNVWLGVSFVLPMVGAFIADSYLGQFRTILLSFVVYILGLGLLTLSTIVPSLKPPDCGVSIDNNMSCTTPSSFQVIFFFISLYLAGIGNSGYKPCACAFGADQFDGRDPEEYKSKSSFFNWWNFAICFGAIITHSILNYIQDNMSWGFSFGILCISMILALLVFLSGTKTYRYGVKNNKENPLFKIAQVFVVAASNWRTESSTPWKTTSDEAVEIGMSYHADHVGAHQFKFLDKALIDTSNGLVGSKRHATPCSISQVEDAKAVLRLFPIWITCTIYAVVLSQTFTFFVKQSSTMDRSLGPKFQIPAASVQIFSNLSMTIFVIFYDRIFVPFARVLTGKPNGITILQRVGGGIFLSIIAMVVAAIVEKTRLQTALDFGLIDMPKATVPMSVWWMIPQYILLGLSSVFTFVGLQEFFYDQVPDGLRSIGISLFYSLFGTGSFLSGFLISIIDKITSGNSKYSWFSNNLNRAHLDYFYWFLAALSGLELVAFLFISKNYLYNRRSSM